MNQYASDSLVTVYPFLRQLEGEEIIIGHLETSIFLVLPTDAVELLDHLADGKTVGQARSFYQAKYGEVPDVETLLTVLEQKGFIEPLQHNISNRSNAVTQAIKSSTKSKKLATVRFHFVNFPHAWAQQIFSQSALACYGLLIALAFAEIAINPSIIPRWDAYFFTKDFTLMRLLLSLMNFVTLFLHEMAHLIAARAVGVSSRLGVGNRLWILVAETDISGVWGVPRNQRYLPFLAGSLLDAVSAAMLVFISFAQHRQWLTLHPLIFQLCQAMLLTYLLRLLWQCYFFVRTDFYYVIANFFRCRSLMKDTEIFVHNWMAQVIHSIRKVDQSYLPTAEKRVVRWYAIVWFLGRVAAISVFVLISLPLMWHYCLALFAVLSSGFKTSPYAFIDALVMILLVSVPQGLGFWLWIRSFRVTQR